MAITTYYATAVELQAELGVNSTTLPDESAKALIRSSEGEIDYLIGARPTDTTTGRKVNSGDVEAWQWAKVKRATLIIASDLYRNADALKAPEWQSVSGPDFSFSGPLHAANRQAVNELDQSGVRRLSAMSTGQQRSRFDSFFTATRHNGT